MEEYPEQLRDMVTFLPDCSSSLEAALEKVGLPRRDSVGHGHVGAYEVGHNLQGQNDLKMCITLYFPVVGRTCTQEVRD